MKIRDVRLKVIFICLILAFCGFLWGDWTIQKRGRIAEFEPRGIHELKIQPRVMECLERLRTRVKYPIIVTSGYRTEEHNEEVGGAPHSYHLKGMAIDCVVNDPDWSLNALASEGLKCGFSTAIIYSTHVHFDIREKGLGIRYAK
ncbi:MAG: peptidase M15 [Candidatus Omnitrophica bacterium]|nr:peptidase M15 [Candidatus Omnitrophota bacterium]MBU1785269.1 peptidase M15 [Candidatus Omnitrophota bacterium]